MEGGMWRFTSLNKPKFKCNLKSIMWYRSVNKSDIAKLLGFSNKRSTEDYILGRSIPRLDYALKIADYLDVDVRDIWRFEDEGIN